MPSLTANRAKDLIARGLINFANHNFYLCLMDRDYVFNRVTHEVYLDIQPFELPTLNGYTQGGLGLVLDALTQNDILNALIVTWNNAVWIAAGGVLEAAGAILYNGSVAAPIANPVMGYIDFNGTLTTLDGGTKTIANIFFAFRAYQ
jgi:hypothetical protein